MKVAAVQMHSVRAKPCGREPGAGIGRVVEWIERAATVGVKLLVFPECTLTGYMLDRVEVQAAAQPLSGDQIEHLQQACSQAYLGIVVGLVEKDDAGHCYNTAVLIGPDGILGSYRKTHLPGFGLDRHVCPGNVLDRTVETPVGRCGLLICYDLYFPEPARALALAGAEILLVPAAWSVNAHYYPDFVLKTRAAENGVFLIAADYVGSEREGDYLGRSIILDPDGQVLAEASGDQEELLVAEIQPRESDHKDRVFQPGVDEINLFADRRPDLYSRLFNQR